MPVYRESCCRYAISFGNKIPETPVNVIAPIMTENGGRAWRQTIYYPFLHFSKHARGTVLKTLVDCPTYQTKDYGAVPVLESVVVANEANEELVVFAVNRSQESDVRLECDLRAFGDWRVAEHTVLSSPSVGAANTADQPDSVVPKLAQGADVRDGSLQAVLPKLSWNVIRIRR